MTVTLSLITETLGDSYALRIYYRVDCEFSFLHKFLSVIPDCAAVTLVPEWKLESEWVAVICGASTR